MKVWTLNEVFGHNEWIKKNETHLMTSSIIFQLATQWYTLEKIWTLNRNKSFESKIMVTWHFDITYTSPSLRHNRSHPTKH